MFRLAKLGVLPSGFIELKYNVRLCASYMFVTSRMMQWITKVNKSESISKDTENKPGYGVLVDQLRSSHPGLVPQFSEKTTSSHIWYAQVMVNHFSDLTYVQLMRSTIHEENLAGKSAFEIWADTFEVKIKIYHIDNGRFPKNNSYQRLIIPTRI